MKIKGFTINKLSSGSLFKDHIHEIVEPELNQTTVLFCTKERHDNICVDMCEMCRPQCDVDKRKFLGLGGHEDVTQKMKERIDKKLASIYKKCREIVIVIKEA